MKKVKFLTTAAVIAALYAALTYVFAFMSYGPIQFRIAEVMTVLPFFTPAAIPGLTLGCILANLTSPLGPVDMIVGGSATLIAAILTRMLPKKLAPLPPIICNAVIVGFELYFVYKMPLILGMLEVAAGEAVVCLVGGYALMYVLDRYGDKAFGKLGIIEKR